MKSKWMDVVAGVLVVAGAVVTFAKLQSYNWWLIGSWKGALGVLAVLGLGILATNVARLARETSLAAFAEIMLWLSTATVVIASLFATTTETEFISSAILIGVAWLAQFADHLWISSHTPTTVAHVH